MAKNKQKIIQRAVVSIGSSHLTSAIVEWQDGQIPHMVDFQESKAISLFRGQPISVEKVVGEIKKCTHAQGKRNETYEQVDVLVSHSHLKKYEFETSIGFSPEHDEITQRDIHEVHAQTCKVVNIPLSEKVIAEYVQEYTVNDLGGIQNPIGLAGERIAVKLALFTLPHVLIRQFEKIFERCDIAVKSWYPRVLAASRTILSEGQRQGSALLIYTGSTLTELIGIENGAVNFYRTLPVGIETVAILMQEVHPMEMEEALTVTEEYGAFGARAHGEERIPFRQAASGESAFVPASDFNRFLSEGIDKISEELYEGISLALRHFRQVPELLLSGRAVNLGELVEKLEMKCGCRVRARGAQDKNIGHYPLFQAPFLGRGIILKEDDEKQNLYRSSIHPLKKVFGAALEWTREHF